MTRCSIHNLTHTSMSISCHAGYDGGLNQSFILEVYDVSRNQEQLILNVSGHDEPRFDVQNLSSETLYSLVVYSVNMKGKSGRTTLKSSTLSAPIDGQITAIGSYIYLSSDSPIPLLHRTISFVLSPSTSEDSSFPLTPRIPFLWSLQPTFCDPILLPFQSEDS